MLAISLQRPDGHTWKGTNPLLGKPLSNKLQGRAAKVASVRWAGSHKLSSAHLHVFSFSTTRPIIYFHVVPLERHSNIKSISRLMDTLTTRVAWHAIRARFPIPCNVSRVPISSSIRPKPLPAPPELNTVINIRFRIEIFCINSPCSLSICLIHFLLTVRKWQV